MKTLAIIGAGYVGLTTACGMASLGHDVICIDIDAEKIDRLKAGHMPIYEPGLCLDGVRFTTEISSVKNADFIFICVGTPSQESGAVDMSYYDAALEAMKPYLNPHAIIINKSTVPVGTAARASLVLGMPVVSNPEFLREGQAVHDFQNPDRIVLGGDKFNTRAVAALYGSIHRVFFMSPESAELTKYAANCMLATRISFANEIARICDDTGANVVDVMEAVGADKRIGPDFLKAGIGYGGSCFPKDVRAMINAYESPIIGGVDSINQLQIIMMVTKILQRSLKFDEPIKEIAIWGRSFKPGTDDTRESPAVELFNNLKQYANIALHDPITNPGGMYDILCGADALVIATDHDEYKNPDFTYMRALMKRPLIFDGRNIYARTDTPGFEVVGVGYRRGL
ncbi:MAG: UDP-glucose/GDP-mannose dehydrogenase family protein [Desulfobacteraceae bacterium]|nr:MAG: UDP-glucose/GDP-mannose dehydrogenase family protein [Desulfobacteraceae bacterium]